MLQLNKIYLGTLETGYNPLIDAAEKDLTEIVTLLIENGASDINASDQEQLWTPIMHAITNNNEIIVKKLLEKRCEINNLDIDGNTPLHLAVMNENEYLIKAIVNAGPDLNIKNKERKTAKDLAKEIDPDLSLLI
jgi:ankyrin repeat protein